MNHFFRILKKQICHRCRTLAVVIVCIGFLYVAFSPSANQTLGNLFFGKVPSLYNVTLAQFFFTQSAYPYIGNSFPYAHYQLSRTYFIQGDLGNALLEIQKELELFPDHKRSYYILGLTYGYMNEEEKAIDSFGKFIKWKPDTWAGRNDKAWLEFRVGRIDDALKTIMPVSHLTSNPWVQNTYGTLLMNKGNYFAAKEAFLYAEEKVGTMTEEEWGRAYPGNDPRIYGVGLNAMRLSIENNLKLIEEKTKE